MATVKYFEVEEMPGRMFFACTRLQAPVLQVSSCADMWRKGNQENVERFSRCKTCPTGAAHAGETAASMSPLMGQCVCARCHRGASRLIGKHLCVSCWNRQREFIIGKNSKGSRPTKMVPLYPRRLRFMCGDDPTTLQLDHTRDLVELVVAALRDSKKRVVFSFSGQFKGPITQPRLF